MNFKYQYLCTTDLEAQIFTLSHILSLSCLHVVESDVCARQCCGQQRSFVMHLTDNAGQEVARCFRDFHFCPGLCCCYCCFCCCCIHQNDADSGRSGVRSSENPTTTIPPSSSVSGGVKKSHHLVASRIEQSSGEIKKKERDNELSQSHPFVKEPFFEGNRKDDSKEKGDFAATSGELNCYISHF
ncbi:unnamed protein product [Protopolystoma xenopodis]|uniref:Phospholipid scramblase n=1 Tax=Protopolystoma xenopodis TaxID=117903 RepID=A0A3S5AH75_9PLAT|nr:unnamed protein product [Protopolystoma xenopodis]